MSGKIHEACPCYDCTYNQDDACVCDDGPTPEGNNLGCCDGCPADCKTRDWLTAEITKLQAR